MKNRSRSLLSLWLFRWVIMRILLTLLLVSPNHRSALAAMTDAATGIAFKPHTETGLEIFGVGVRKKGPIKVYSVALYSTSALKDALVAAVSHSDGKAAVEAASKCLQEGAKRNAPEAATAYELRMHMSVSGEKMAQAIADSVLPRVKHSKNINSNKEDDIAQLKSLIQKGTAGSGAAKGTVLRFDCNVHDSKLTVSVNGQVTGCVHSRTLAEAFNDVYLDDRCVSPALKKSILDHCCAP